jgi:hypothetical protein
LVSRKLDTPGSGGVKRARSRSTLNGVTPTQALPSNSSIGTAGCTTRRSSSAGTRQCANSRSSQRCFITQALT